MSEFVLPWLEIPDSYVPDMTFSSGYVSNFKPDYGLSAAVPGSNFGYSLGGTVNLYSGVGIGYSGGSISIEPNFGTSISIPGNITYTGAASNVPFTISSGWNTITIASNPDMCVSSGSITYGEIDTPNSKKDIDVALDLVNIMSLLNLVMLRQDSTHFGHKDDLELWGTRYPAKFFTKAYIKGLGIDIFGPFWIFENNKSSELVSGYYYPEWVDAILSIFSALYEKSVTFVSESNMIKAILFVKNDIDLQRRLIDAVRVNGIYAANSVLSAYNI